MSSKDKPLTVSSKDKPLTTPSKDKNPTATKRHSSFHSQEMETDSGSDPALDPLPTALTSKRPKNIPVPDNYARLANNRYKPDIEGPYSVHIEKVLSPPDQTGAVGVLKIGKTLLAHVPILMKAALDFKRAGHNRFSITFPFAKQANTFVLELWNIKHALFPDELWITYIPNFRVTRQMIIRGIDDDSITPDFIMDNILPHHSWNGHWNAPLEITRLKKRAPDDKSQNGFLLVDTNLFIATFHNTVVPTCAILLGKTIFFNPFIQRVRRCSKCQRFGHTGSLCKSSGGGCYCESCGELGHNNTDCSNRSIRCINCIRAKTPDVNHRASDPRCPIFLRQKEIKKIMATIGLSPGEATDFLDARGPLSDQPRNRGWNVLRGPPLSTLADFFPPLPSRNSQNHSTKRMDTLSADKKYSNHRTFNPHPPFDTSGNTSISYNAPTQSNIPNNDTLLSGYMDRDRPSSEVGVGPRREVHTVDASSSERSFGETGVRHSPPITAQTTSELNSPSLRDQFLQNILNFLNNLPLPSSRHEHNNAEIIKLADNLVNIVFKPIIS